MNQRSFKFKDRWFTYNFELFVELGKLSENFTDEGKSRPKHFV